MKIISLETIAVMRVTASDCEGRAKAARQGNEPEAGMLELIARELRQIIHDKAHERAYATARFITNANSGIRPADARAIAAAIEATPATEEVSVRDLLPGDKGVGYRVRLVYYYDPTTKTKRWALEYTNDRDRPAISDNERREDAEFRYQEFVRMFGVASN